MVLPVMAVLRVLAHEGGWDEIVLVAVPVLVLAGLLFLARRRAQALADARAVDGSGSEAA